MALGMIEVYGFATAIVVADAMAKAAEVKVVARRPERVPQRQRHIESDTQRLHDH